LTTKKATHQCPECDHAPYPTAKGLSTHRRFAHGISGTSHSAVSERRRRAKLKQTSHHDNYPSRIKGKYPCPNCNFVASWEGGLKNHITRVHASAKPAKRRNELANIPKGEVITNGHHPEAHREGFTDAIPDALIAVASGRFIELCRSVAYEHDLPPRLFTARVAAFIYGTTVR
jgi:hypothetical protein